VDMTIRSLTNGRRSLNDFCRAFYGGSSGHPELKPYTFDDLVAALNAVAPNDWRAFLNRRLTSTDPTPPLGGIETSGWRLVYNDHPNWYQSLRERTTKQTDASFTLGMWVKQDGTIADVVYQGPAYEAGLVPGMKITSIDGRKYAEDVLVQETEAASGTSKPIEVGVEQVSVHGQREGDRAMAHYLLDRLRTCSGRQHRCDRRVSKNMNSNMSETRARATPGLRRAFRTRCGPSSRACSRWRRGVRGAEDPPQGMPRSLCV